MAARLKDINNPRFESRRGTGAKEAFLSGGSQGVAVRGANGVGKKDKAQAPTFKTSKEKGQERFNNGNKNYTVVNRPSSRRRTTTRKTHVFLFWGLKKIGMRRKPLTLRSELQKDGHQGTHYPPSVPLEKRT